MANTATAQQTSHKQTLQQDRHAKRNINDGLVGSIYSDKEQEDIDKTASHHGRPKSMGAAINQSTKHKSSLAANRLASGMAKASAASGINFNKIAGINNPNTLPPQQNQQPPLRTPEAQAAQRDMDRDTPESMQPRGTGEVDPTPVSQLRSQMANLKARKASTNNDDAKDELEAMMEKQKERLRKAVKRKVEAGVKRGIIYVVDLIAGCLDLGTTGISTLIDVIFYVFTFGWLNLELIYGRAMRGGKDPFISPLSWDPIPMPVDPKGNILAGFLIAADLALFFIIFAIFALGMCAGFDYYQYLSNPPGFIIGAVTSGGGNACLGGILYSALGLF